MWKDYWLDPDGKLHVVSPCHHDEWADQYIRKNNLETDDELCPYQILHKLGWVRISLDTKNTSIYGDCINLMTPIYNTMDPAMNSVQLRVAENLCIEYGITLYQAINDKKFWYR